MAGGPGVSGNVPVSPAPATGSAMVRHLVDVHRLDEEAVAAASSAEHRVWHDAEHRNLEPSARQPRHSGHLTHTHHHHGVR